MSNLLLDSVTTLNLAGYPGNVLTVQLTVAGDSPMPSVVSKTYYADSGSLLPDNRQAIVSISGRVIQIRYQSTIGLPESAYHEILFDNRIVLAGALRMVRSTVATPTTVQATLSINDPASPLQVEIVGYTVTGSGSGEIPQELTDHLTDYDNPHQTTATQVGLGNVDNTSDANKPVSTAQLTALNGKVDKVTGKQLSTEDYTTAEKTKLAGIATGATANSSDATLLSRSNHTGTQTAATISDFATAADARITAQKGQINGLATLDSSGTVPASQLPSFVDDVIECVNLAAFPVTGESSKIYVALDSNKTYRWSGSAYIEIAASPGSTDVVTEGSNNKYFTENRVLNTLLTGLVTAASAVLPVSTDTLLIALGKIKKILSDIQAAGYQTASDVSTAIAGKQNTLVSGTNIKTINSNSLLGSGDIAITSNPVTTTTNSSASGTISWAWATAINYLKLTTSGNITLANPTGLTQGWLGEVEITLGGANHTISFGTNWKWPNSTVPTFPTTSGSVIVIRVYSDGTNVYAEWANSTQIATNASKWKVDSNGDMTFARGFTNPLGLFMGVAGAGQAYIGLTDVNTPTSPKFSFSAASTYGLGLATTSILSLIANSINALNINSSGNIAIGTTSFNTRDKLQVNGSMSFSFASGSADPTTTDLPAGQSILWKNTTSGAIKWFVNDAGTIKSGTAFS